MNVILGENGTLTRNSDRNKWCRYIYVVPFWLQSKSSTNVAVGYLTTYALYPIKKIARFSDVAPYLFISNANI